MWRTCGTALLPNIPLRMARQRPTITSSLMFSMMPAASPAIRASRMGAEGGRLLDRLARVSGPNRTSAGPEAASALTFVEVPEEEELAPAGRGGADVTEQVDAGVPEHAVEAQHHLRTERGENSDATARPSSPLSHSFDRASLNSAPCWRRRVSSSVGCVIMQHPVCSKTGTMRGGGSVW